MVGNDSEIAVVAKPKRRRFSVAEKARTSLPQHKNLVGPTHRSQPAPLP